MRGREGGGRREGGERVAVGGRGGRKPVRHECYAGQCHFSHGGERQIEKDGLGYYRDISYQGKVED